MNDRDKVRRWMNANCGMYSNATMLAEGCHAAGLISSAVLDDETHWIWDEAARFYNE